MKSIRVSKFGGTSMGDAACIRRAAEIVVSSGSDGASVVVVSAMGGVTDRLIAAAQSSEKGNADAASEIRDVLRQQHLTAIEALIANSDKRAQLASDLETIIEEVMNLCRGTSLLHELTPRTLRDQSQHRPGEAYGVP